MIASLAPAAAPAMAQVTRTAFRLSPADLHEFYTAADADAPNMTGAALALAGMMQAEIARAAPILWIRHDYLDHEDGAPYAVGLTELGLDPGRMILVRARDGLAALQAGLEGARCGAIGAVLIELRGEMKAVDTVALRRLSLAARSAGTLVLLLRVAARPQPSPAQTRWQIRAAPSRALAANAPGKPAFELILLRARNGEEGVRHHLEWDRDTRSFIACAPARKALRAARPDNPPLSGHLVSLSGLRPADEAAGPPVLRQTG